MANRILSTTTTAPVSIPYSARIDNSNGAKVLYDTLYAAFDHFNAALFDSRLDAVMLVLHRKRNAHGYFWKDVWSRDGSAVVLSEIAVNPEAMGREPKEVLSTLVHEMVHHEQHMFGKPSKSGHNAEWCEWMERIGLNPIGVGNCDGKRSGRHFSHTVVSGGAFDVAADAFLAEHDGALGLCSKAAQTAKKQDPSKVKFTCPECGANAWGKVGLALVCGCCEQRMLSKYLA